MIEDNPMRTYATDNVFTISHCRTTHMINVANIRILIENAIHYLIYYIILYIIIYVYLYIIL